MQGEYWYFLVLALGNIIGRGGIINLDHTWRKISIKEETKRAYEYIVHRRKPYSYITLVDSFPVIDIGCGSGNNCIAIKGFVVCFDIAEKQLIEAKKKGCEYLVQGDMEYLPFRDESFRFAMALASLHHLDDPKIALREMKRVLKANGKVLITVWLGFIRRRMWKESNFNGIKLRRFYKRYLPWELRSICEKEGFKTISYKLLRIDSFLPNNALYFGKIVKT
jgi:ubiquinone/menaquinone biosynthesis C-methylase UbiE